MEHLEQVTLPGAFPSVDPKVDTNQPASQGIMFFHAYCTGAIEKHMADRGAKRPSIRARGTNPTSVNHGKRSKTT